MANNHHHGEQHGAGDAPATPVPTVVRDPVCGMTVDPVAGKPALTHGDRDFHFCSSGCKARFEASPDAYVEAKDPVCGMTVQRASAKHFFRHDGTGHYFCSARMQAEVRSRTGPIHRRAQA